jgi:signal transduction histidine kinase
MDSLPTFADLGGLGLICPDSVPTVFGLLDPSIAPPFLYYSYIPIIVITLLFGTYVLMVSRASWAGHAFIWLSIVFSLLTAGELFLWIAAPAALVHFVWQLITILHGILAFLLVYFTYAFLNDKNMPSAWQWLLLLPVLPIIVLAPTSINLESFDLVNCESIQGLLRTYTYAIQTGALAIAFFLCAWESRHVREKSEYRKAIILGIGIVIFFGIYILSNVFGDATLVYDINLFGPLGMVVFLGTVGYLMVRYRAFHVRILAAQALIAALVALVFAALFVHTIEDARFVLGGTLLFITILGLLLVRSVKREVLQRERIEKLASELEATNRKQEGLLHFIGHEVKGYLTKDANAFAALAEGDFGPLPDETKAIVVRALEQSREGERSVTDILTASNQKKGTISYQKQSFDLKASATEIVDRSQNAAKEKGLVLSLSLADNGTPYIFTGDREKITENVFRNLIDNSLNYTQKGLVEVALKKADGKYVFSVKDTGIGISDEDKKHLFTEGGHGKDSQRINVHSTGYGLYIAKNIVEAHGGTIRAESEGPGTGSTFTVELPVAATKEAATS